MTVMSSERDEKLDELLSGECLCNRQGECFDCTLRAHIRTHYVPLEDVRGMLVKLSEWVWWQCFDPSLLEEPDDDTMKRREEIERHVGRLLSEYGYSVNQPAEETDDGNQ